MLGFCNSVLQSIYVGHQLGLLALFPGFSATRPLVRESATS